MSEAKINIFRDSLSIEEALGLATTDPYIRGQIEALVKDENDLDEPKEPIEDSLVEHINNEYKISNPETIELILDSHREIIEKQSRQQKQDLIFEEIVTGQFPETEEEVLAPADEGKIIAAKQKFKDFLSGKTESEYVEDDFVKHYLELLKACGLDEALANRVFLEIVDGEA